MACQMQGRVTMKKKCANPLFEKWLKEWKDQARENNSKMQYTFGTALKSLQKYPITLNSGKECMILNGFGATLCSMLDKKLKEYKNSDQSSQTLADVQFAGIASPQTNKSTKSKKIKAIKSKTPTKTYFPAKRSGAYAILITLIKKSQEPDYSGSLTKTEIIDYAYNLCDKSFTKRDPGSFYTAWSSMATLISKELVAKKGKPPKYSLTDQGELTAIKLLENDEATEPKKDDNNYIANLNKSLEQANLISGGSKTLNCDNNEPNYDLLANGRSEKNSTSSEIVDKIDEAVLSQDIDSSEEIGSSPETFIFPPYSFDIILLVDSQETCGANAKPSDDEALSELRRLDVNFEVRHLNVGDFAWISRDRNTKQELILPYLVERKRMDDFGHSIKDGRYKEQKFRLKNCGIPNITYIIESYGNNTRTVLPMATLMQAATNTRVCDEFDVQYTDNLRHSMQYLAIQTCTIKRIFEKKTLMSCPRKSLPVFNISDDLISLMTFKEFNKSCSKNKKLTVKEVFVKMLIQIKGLSLEKVLAIVEKYPTPRLLKNEYDRLGPKGEKLLSTITYGPLKKAIGPALSRTIWQLYTMETFP